MSTIYFTEFSKSETTLNRSKGSIVSAISLNQRVYYFLLLLILINQ